MVIRNSPTFQVFDPVISLLENTPPRTKTAAERYIDAWNRRDVEHAVKQFTENAVLEDTSLPGAFVGQNQIKRHLLLSADAFKSTPKYIIDDVTTSFCGSKVGITWHVEGGRRAISFYNLQPSTGLIESVFHIEEPTVKSGKINLAILSAAGKFIEKTGINIISDDETSNTPSSDAASGGTLEASQDSGDPGWFGSLFGKSENQSTSQTTQTTAAERYFDAWNKRDMDAAIDVFSDDCEYDDTVFPEPFSGKDELKNHLMLCADSFPSTFSFVVDDVAPSSESDKLCVKWHIENNGEQLPFTRGCSFYNLDKNTGLITKGIDFVEPSNKIGGIQLAAQSLVTKLTVEPIRAIPMTLWVAYMYVVFFSDGILPGANALQLEQRTWEEVRDLSLNFFLVAPLLHLPFSPVVHPMLEGVFNLLLSYAALFAGFLSDERPNKPNTLPMLPMVAGMQFLTSAFFLPYLGTRSSETLPENGKVVYKQDLDAPGRIVGESRVFGPLLGSVGLASIVWGFLGRFDDFGDLNERFASFVDLLSIDRVGSSFIVDSVIFAAFQGWLVKDDLKRRGVKEGEYTGLRTIANYVPFFGLVAYVTLRPPLPSKSDTT